LAEESNVLHRPSTASIFAAEKAMNVKGLQREFTPPAKAFEHWERRNLERHKSAATKDAEQAVSTIILGPVRPSTNERRFAAIDAALPVPEKGEDSAAAAALSEAPPHPTKTPIVEPNMYFLVSDALLND
jgi:hypothetical protein